MGDEMTYPWKKDYVAPNPIKEKIHTIVSIDVFETTPTELNKERYDELQKLFSQNYIA